VTGFAKRLVEQLPKNNQKTPLETSDSPARTLITSVFMKTFVGG